MHQAALVASNHNADVEALVDQRRKDGKPRNSVIMAVARKLVMIAGALCKSRQWLSEAPVCHAAALHEFAWISRRNGAQSSMFLRNGEDSRMGIPP